MRAGSTVDPRTTRRRNDVRERRQTDRRRSPGTASPAVGPGRRQPVPRLPGRHVRGLFAGDGTMNQPLAYTIPYATYRLIMCLRCAKTYPEGPDKVPVTVIRWRTLCDKCHNKIPGTER